LSTREFEPSAGIREYFGREAAVTTISGKQDPVVLRIGAADVIEALGKGLRDFQAMPLHINGHVDRITEQLGRISLGLDSQNPF